MLRHPCRCSSCASSCLRLLTTAITLFGVAVIVFVLIRVVPGIPIAMMLPPGATEADIARAARALRAGQADLAAVLDLGHRVLQGDFGTSISMRQPCWTSCSAGCPPRWSSSIMALVMAVLLGGCVALTRHAPGAARGPKARIDIANGIALSVPDFLWGLV